MRQSGDTDRTIKAQLNKIVLIPSITFLVLFGIASMGALAEAISLRMATSDSRSGLHAYRAVVELQQERRLAVDHLGAPSEGSLDELQRQTEITDNAVSEIENRSDGLSGRGDDDGAANDSARAFLTALDERDALRENVTSQNTDVKDATANYTNLIDLGLRAYNSLGRLLDDSQAATANADALELMRAQEHLSLADAVLTGADAEGAMAPAEQARFGALIGDGQQRLESVEPALRDDTARQHAQLLDSEHWDQLNQLARTVTRHDLGGSGEADEPPPSLGEWRSSADDANADLVALTESQARKVTAATEAASAEMLTLALAGGIIVLFTTTVAYGVASKAAAWLTYRLARLRAETLELSREELPRLVRRLENGEQVNPDAELRQLDHGSDEVGQVADAFNTAQRTAVATALKQAEVRDGANRVFMGIAHRNQSLVQRQLQVLDRVEREAEDPDLLEDLFQLDHLATRGRRNAENLIILGGAQPGRRWRNPIPLVDVLRGAISETEEYARVKLRVVPDLSIPGSVVADVLHLLAELVENATAFSPPHTTVHIHAESVANGLAVEVEDRGLGMSAHDLSEANRRLGEAPEFDVMALNQEARLGLFVVARLANKHGIHVELRPSPYGGTCAVVLIPAALVTRTTPATTRPQAELKTGAPLPNGRPVGGGHTNGTSAVPGATAGSDRPDVAVAGFAPAPEQSRQGELPKRNPGSSLSSAPDPGPAAPEHDSGRPPLPKRHRQANIAPQLREHDTPGDTAGVPGQPDQNPEEVRRMFSAFQAGTQRGREGNDGFDRETGERGAAMSSATTTTGDVPAASPDGGIAGASPTDTENDGHARGANGPDPLPGGPAYTAGARNGHAGRQAGY